MEKKKKRVLSDEDLLSNEDLIELYRKMVLARRFDVRMPILQEEGHVVGSMNASTGQEAVGIGACFALRKDDYITSTHRGHHHYIGKGINLKKMVAEICGKATGLGGGRGGHMVMADYDSGIVGGTAVVGGNITVATGVGLSIKLRGTDQVVVCFFGDGASSTGSFHEGINLGAVWNLPVIYICENNQYALTTPIRQQIAREGSIAKRGIGYGISWEEVDGNDVLAVYSTTKKAVERARKGQGPSLIEAKTYRIAPFSTRDRGGYRPDSEVEEYRKKDSILNFENYLIKENILSDDIRKEINEDTEKTISEAIQFALDSPWPDPKSVFNHLYKENV